MSESIFETTTCAGIQILDWETGIKRCENSNVELECEMSFRN